MILLYLYKRIKNMKRVSINVINIIPEINNTNKKLLEDILLSTPTPLDLTKLSVSEYRNYIRTGVYHRNPVGIGTLNIPLNYIPSNFFNGEGNFIVPNKEIEINSQFGLTYTLAVSDNKNLINFYNSLLTTVTIPSHSNIPLPVGAQIDCIQASTGIVIFTGETNVIIHSKDNLIGTSGQWKGVTLVQIAVNEWILYGDLSVYYPPFLLNKISAGYNHSLAIDNNNQAWAWGSNYNGELGDNTTTNQSTPVTVCGNHTFCQIAAGSGFSLAIDNNGRDWGWGYNGYGELRDNTTESQLTPVAVY